MKGKRMNQKASEETQENNGEIQDNVENYIKEQGGESIEWIQDQCDPEVFILQFRHLDRFEEDVWGIPSDEVKEQYQVSDEEMQKRPRCSFKIDNRKSTVTWNGALMAKTTVTPEKLQSIIYG